MCNEADMLLHCTQRSSAPAPSLQVGACRIAADAHANHAISHAFIAELLAYLNYASSKPYFEKTAWASVSFRQKLRKSAAAWACLASLVTAPGYLMGL